MREKRGITLIALVVTIVVLLILAGVSINMLRGENGLIKKASDSKLETRAGNIEEEVQLWKNNNKMIKKQNEVTGANQALVSKEDMLKKLTDEKIAYENEINRNNETITVKRNDGTIVRVIKYNDVKINISKSPETEQTRAVLLNVDSVEGIPKKYTEEEIPNVISNMDENEMKERIKELAIYFENAKTFEEVLNGDSEDEFWNQIKEGSGSIEGGLKNLLEINIYVNNKINRYITINPEGEYSSTYYATENGTYEFTVEDILTGNRYTEKVEVTNIDKTALQFVVGSYLDSFNWPSVILYDVNEKKYTTFEKAYIIINEKKVDISDTITFMNVEDLELSDINQYMVDNFNMISSDSIKRKLISKKEIQENYKFWNTKQEIILVKDNIEYTGTIIMHEGEAN